MPVFRSRVEDRSVPVISIFPVEGLEFAARQGPGYGPHHTITAVCAEECVPEGYLLVGGPYPNMDLLVEGVAEQVHNVSDATVKRAREFADSGSLPRWVQGYMKMPGAKTPIGELVALHFAGYAQS